MHTDHTSQVVSTPQALAEAVAADGFDAHNSEVADLITDARRVGVCELLATVALDGREPTVVRERAFGRLVASYTAALASGHLDVGVGTAPTTSDRFTVAA